MKGDPKISQEGKKRENDVLVYICFEMSELVLMLTINSEMRLWKWDGVFVGKKCGYKHKLGESETGIKSGS